MKKYLSITQKLISSICIFTQAFLLVGIPSVAYATENIDNSSEAVLENESSSVTAETLSSPAGSSSPDLTYS